MFRRFSRPLPEILVTIAASLSLISCGKSQTEQASTSGTPQTTAVAMTPVERGKYLTTIEGCNDCHTPGALYGVPDMTRQLSGSELGWRGPWGVTFPRNLTPDTETGIGAWTEQDIVKAIRTGYRPDGTQLLPPMPWPDLAILSDEDANAIAAFLKSIPAVNHRNPSRVPPGVDYKGPALTFPPPPAWDVPAKPKP